MMSYKRGPEFINEPVSVEVRVHGDATIVPVAFVWRGRRHVVDSWGRESFEDHGGRKWRTWLVQTSGLETWELCQDKETAQWTLVRHWAGKSRIL